MGAQRGDATATRQAILVAARELFAAHGVDGVSVRDIAAAAGVNHALVHRYFGAKGDMVDAILAVRGRGDERHGQDGPRRRGVAEGAGRRSSSTC